MSNSWKHHNPSKTNTARVYGQAAAAGVQKTVRVVGKASDRHHAKSMAKATRTTNQHDVHMAKIKLASCAALFMILVFACTGPPDQPPSVMCENTLNPGVTFQC